MSFLAPERWLDHLLPEACAACDGPVVPRGGLLCAACGASCRSPSPRTVSGVLALAAFVYEDPIKSILERFKYRSQPELARRLARAIVERTGLTSLLHWRDAVIVPVPLHPERLATRGYNQSALLGSRIARRLDARSAPRALLRVSHTRQQAGASRLERERNLANQIAPRARLSGPVVLVDDVLTTGATLRACIQAVRRAGGDPRVLVTVASAE